jgi:1-hydroxycarotenoid 3,4-desaturase
LGLGVWHLQGGFARLVADLRAMLERLGVEIRLDCEVLALEQTGGKISGITTNTGLERADLYISALDRAFTLELLGRAAPTYPLGVSGFAVLLKLEGDHGLSHQIRFPQDYALEWADISSGTLPRDPTLYLHTDGNTGFLMVNSPPVPAPDKAGYTKALLERLAAWQNLPVLEHTVLAPQDYARFGLRGALYGRAPHGLLGTLRHPWHYAGVGNLWQVGGTVHPGGGVPLSLLSGWNGAGQAMGLAYDRLGL